MNKKILVINGGSSSIKFKVFEYDNFELISSGLCERIFVDGNFEMKFKSDSSEFKKIEENVDFPNHEAAIQHLLKKLEENKVINDVNEIVGVGHRVVQGAYIFDKSCIIDSEVEAEIEKLIPLAPLHNEPELAIIKIIRKLMPNSVNVAVFDTSFHTTIPSINSTYAIPEDWREELKIRRYGAHGTSFRYINEAMEKELNKKNLNLIVCHLGNGASICAIKDGKSFNTTMGLTPLEGLVMGTRSGDVDPSIFKYISNEAGLDSLKIDHILNKESGLKGLCGYSDFRDITPKVGIDEKCTLAFNLFCSRVADYVIKYTNQLGNKLDALVFTAGIGENVAKVRETICSMLTLGHFHLDKNLNANINSSICKINKEINCSKKIYMVATNEELMIATDVRNLIEKI